MKKDSSITVALVFPTIQSRRKPTSPKRNLNLESATRRVIFAPTIFTKLFNDGERKREVFVCRPRGVTRRAKLTWILTGFNPTCGIKDLLRSLESPLALEFPQWSYQPRFFVCGETTAIANASYNEKENVILCEIVFFMHIFIWFHKTKLKITRFNRLYAK